MICNKSIVLAICIGLIMYGDAKPIEGHRRPFHGKKITCSKKKVVDAKPVRITAYEPRACWGDHRKRDKQKPHYAGPATDECWLINHLMSVGDLERIYAYLCNQRDIIFNNHELRCTMLWAIVEQPDDTEKQLLLRKQIAKIIVNDDRVLDDKEACSIARLLLSDPVRLERVADVIKNPTAQTEFLDPWHPCFGQNEDSFYEDSSYESMNDAFLQYYISQMYAWLCTKLAEHEGLNFSNMLWAIVEYPQDLMMPEEKRHMIAVPCDQDFMPSTPGMKRAIVSLFLKEGHELQSDGIRAIKVGVAHDFNLFGGRDREKILNGMAAATLANKHVRLFRQDQELQDPYAIQ